MRKIRIIEQISLDGVIQAPGGRDEGGDDYAHGGWAMPYFDTALGEAKPHEFASFGFQDSASLLYACPLN